MPDNKPNSETRERILDVAEGQFMAFGYEGTSMRMITAAARVNLAAVNYHFVSKENLLLAVLHRRLAWLNNERLKVLDELEQQAGGKPLKPSRILEAFFGTLLTIGENESLGGMTFLRLLGRTAADPAEFIQSFLAGEYSDVLERYRQALFRSLPEVPKDEIVWRFHFMLGTVSHAIAGTDALKLLGDFEFDERAGTAPDASESRQLCARLMPFLLGGLQAPLPVPGAMVRWPFVSLQACASEPAHREGV